MAEPAANIAEYTVSEISVAVKRTIEDAFGYVRVRGEVSGYRGPHSSGHAYFVLKDDKARLEAVVWRGAFRKLKFKPEEGLEVVATGRLTTYPGSSKYQIVIESLQPAGAGALMALLEERRKKLAAEGLFDEARKKPLPYLPRVIGVVTSPTGAVIRDILHRLSDRFPVRVIVWPVRVQGETSAAEVAAAVAGFNALKADGTVLRPDVLIVARGGGSLEDLWSFSEEIVVRAVAASQIPVIAAVGHETDWTLIDHVADRRAPTPTGAAEIAVPVRAELVTTLQSTASRLIGGALRLIEGNRRELRGAARALPRAEDLFAAQRRTFDELAGRLAHALVVSTQIRRTQFERVAARHSPHNLGRLSEGLSDQYAALMQRVDTATARIVERARSRYQQAVARHSPRNLMRLTEGARERIGALSRRGGQATARLIERSGARYGSLAKLLEALSYRKVLQRGFALVSSDGTPLRSASSVAPGNALDIEFHDGHVAATANAGGTRPKSRKRPAPKGSQGSLF